MLIHHYQFVLDLIYRVIRLARRDKISRNDWFEMLTWAFFFFRSTTFSRRLRSFLDNLRLIGVVVWWIERVVRFFEGRIELLSAVVVSPSTTTWLTIEIKIKIAWREKRRTSFTIHLLMGFVQQQAFFSVDDLFY